MYFWEASSCILYSVVAWFCSYRHSACILRTWKWRLRMLSSGIYVLNAINMFCIFTPIFCYIFSVLNIDVSVLLFIFRYLYVFWLLKYILDINISVLWHLFRCLKVFFLINVCSEKRYFCSATLIWMFWMSICLFYEPCVDVRTFSCFLTSGNKLASPI